MSSNGGSIQLTAQPRTEKKGSALRGLRLKGRIPAVVYGSELEGTPVHVDAKEFNKVVRTGRSEVFNLTVEGEKPFRSSLRIISSVTTIGCMPIF